MWHDLFIHVTWPIHICDMTHSYMIQSHTSRHNANEQVKSQATSVWHDSFILVTWLIHTCHKTRQVTRQISSKAVSKVYVWHDSLLRVTWLIPMRDITHSYVTICVTHKSWSGSAASTMRAIFLGHLEQYRVLQFFDIENETSSVCHELKESSIWRLWTIFSALYCAFHHPLSVLLFTDSGRVWVRASAIFFLASRPELSCWPRAV